MTEIKEMKTTVLAAGDINLSNFHLATNVQKQALAKVEKNALIWILSLITTIESQATEIEELEEERDSIQRDYNSACEMSTGNHKEALRLFDIVESQKEEIKRLRKLMLQSQEEEEERIRFKMDANGNLTRIED